MIDRAPARVKPAEPWRHLIAAELFVTFQAGCVALAKALEKPQRR